MRIETVLLFVSFASARANGSSLLSVVILFMNSFHTLSPCDLIAGSFCLL